MVKAEFGDEAPSELCQACHEATGGNAFFLTELLTELRSGTQVPSATAIEAVRSLGPERIAASILLRLGRLHPAAPRLGRAIAVLGSEADPDHAARLADLPVDEARELAGLLVDGAVLEAGEPFRFVHPIVRTAVYEDIPRRERARLHAEAAELLASAGAGSESVAVHLLATDPAGNDLTVERLREAAEAAIARGSPEPAVRYLQRALQEPPPDAERSDVFKELGSACWIRGDSAAFDHLRESIRFAEPGRPRALATLALAIALSHVQPAESTGALEAAIEELPDGEEELSRELEADLLAASLISHGVYRRFVERSKAVVPPEVGESPVDRRLLAGLAFKRALECTTAEEAADLAMRAQAAGLLADYVGGAIAECELLTSLIYAERFDVADRYLDMALTKARSWGSLTGVVLATRFSAFSALRQGDLATAEARARESIETAELAGFEPRASHFSAHVLGEALIDRGRVDEAIELLGEITAEDLEAPSFMTCCAVHTRARVHLAAGRPDEALVDLELLHDQVRDYIDRNPAVMPYRSTLAVALAQRGEVEAARRLATEEVEGARTWGTPGAMGCALHVAAMVERGDASLALLEEAASTLERSEARLEHARALIDLGAALRRAGSAADARERLEQGMDLAHRCGASALVDRAMRELELTGARPRRAALRGRDSLTPAELRVAEMAAAGMANKEIAQALFVTLRTIEMHLTNAYGKLEISSRRGLDAALSE